MTRSAAHVLAELLGVPYADKRELLDEFVDALTPSRTNGAGDNRPFKAIGTVADALPKDAEQDAIVEEVFARATKTKPTPQPGDRVGPDDVGAGDVVRESMSAGCTVVDTLLVSRRGDAWSGTIVASNATTFRLLASNTVVCWAGHNVTLVARAAPTPAPPPIQLQVGHRYRARDGSEWDCVHDYGRHVIDTLRFECNPVVAGESCLFSWDGGYYTNETSPRDLIEDLGPTPSADGNDTSEPAGPTLDIDAVLAPIEHALEHIAGLSNDTRASEIATTAYGVAGNVLRQAVGKAREVGRG